MKKIAVLALALTALFSYAAAQEFKVVMKSTGAIEEVSWNGNQIYPPKDGDADPTLDPFFVRLANGKPFPRVLNVGTKVTIKISDFVDGGTYRINIATQKIKYDLLPIYTGKTQGIVTKAVPTVTNEWSFFLDESGTTYAIKVTRLATDPAKDKDKDIFTENLQTRARYYFGSHIGVFVPFGQSTKYSLGYMTPSDTNATIMENKRQNVTMVFIGSIYPFGFEPEGEVLTPRRVQVNLATELSGSIFQKIYFGLGYDFTYFSISLLGRFGATDELQNGFKPGDLITGSLKSVPTVSKNKWDWGMTLNLPIDLMMGWLGKSLGLK